MTKLINLSHKSHRLLHKQQNLETTVTWQSDLRASYLRFSGLCATAVGATVSNTPLLVVTAVTPVGRPVTPGISDAGPLLVNSTRPGGSMIPDVGGRTNIRRASDVTIKRCWARIACRCCSVRPAKFGITERPGTVCSQQITHIKYQTVVSLTRIQQQACTNNKLLQWFQSVFHACTLNTALHVHSVVYMSQMNLYTKYDVSVTRHSNWLFCVFALFCMAHWAMILYSWSFQLKAASLV